MSLFANYVPFKIELEKHIGHCKTVFDEIGDHTSSSLVEGFIKDLENQRYNITILGGLKRGKSTLLNAMMERKDDYISPISSEVCTSSIIKYLDKDLSNFKDKKEHAVIYFDNTELPPTTVLLQRLKDYVTEAQNPGNRKQVRSVDVFGDFPGWSKAVTIIDSPGHGSVFSHHDVLLSDFLPYTDAIIFLVAADIPLDSGDIALLQELSENEKRKIFFVLTKIDNIDNPNDLPDVIEFVKIKIQEKGLHCDKIFTVSAKPVYDALVNGSSELELQNLKDKNGLSELENDLEQFIVSESDQTKVLRSRIEMLLEKTSKACKNYITTFDAILSRKSYDFVKLQSEENELSDANSLLKVNTKKALQKFERDWKKELTGFQRKFSSKSGRVEEKIIEKLNRGNLIGAIFQSFKLKQQVQNAVGKELLPEVNGLELKLNEVIRTLNEEFDEELDLYVKKHTGTDVGTTIGSLVTLGSMAGTVTWGLTATSTAISSAMTAFGAWQTSVAASTTATATNSTAAVGAISKSWGWLSGFGGAATKATAAADATANAAIAGSSALTAGVSAVITAGVSIAVTLLVQKMLHIGLVKIQETKVLGITEKIMEDMENSLFNSLDAYKDNLVKEYEQQIEYIISDRQQRIAEIKTLILSDNSDERKLITDRLEQVQGLLAEGVHIQKQIPMFS